MKRRSRENALPDLTPLIDVVFLLLIFFMVSTVFKKDEMALLLNLPKTTEGETTSKSLEDYRIELSSIDIAVNGKKIPLESLDSLLSNIKKKTSPVELRVDKDVKYERLIKVLDRLKYFELTNLSLITQN
jgi:biopolymer transport protein ExbD